MIVWPWPWFVWLLLGTLVAGLGVGLYFVFRPNTFGRRK